MSEPSVETAEGRELIRQGPMIAQSGLLRAALAALDARDAALAEAAKEARAAQRKVRLLQGEIRWLQSLADEPDELGAAAHKIAALEAALAEARTAERERCAKVADSAGGWYVSCEQIAAAIRALRDPG